MDNNDWLILQALYKNKNISKTAQSLYIAQPTLSKRLQRMEKDFGFKIYNREVRGINFTPKGEYIAHCAEEMLIKFREIKENVLNMDINNYEGTLRLGVSKLFTRYRLPLILKNFKKKYPNVKFQVITTTSFHLEKLVDKKKVHIGFGRGDYNWQGQKQLLYDEVMCVVSKNKISLDELPDLSRIDYPTNYKTKTVIENWWIEHFPKLPLIGMEVDNADTCKEMVLHGLGYAILPSIVLNSEDSLYKVAISDKDGMQLLRRTWMLYHKESLQLNIVNTFVKFVVNSHIGMSSLNRTNF